MPIPVSVAFGLRRHHAPPILHGLDTITDEEDPPELIQGVLHQGCKLLLAGTSKTNKTWLLIASALCVACGVPWLGFSPAPGGRSVYSQTPPNNFTSPAGARHPSQSRKLSGLGQVRNYPKS